MKRIPEPELMNDPLQAQAYAAADFDLPHAMFIRLFQETFPDILDNACVLDLGCGPGDITFRFARAYPGCRVHGVDGSEAMLAHARQALAAQQAMQGRVMFMKKILQVTEPSLKRYDIIISNSLLHHLSDPAVLWNTVRSCAASGARVFIMDLKRPESIGAAQQLTDAYAAGEPEILRRDFYNSLLAAFTTGEIRQQLISAGLAGFAVHQAGDRHVVVSGRIEF
ncbi:MAG: class I SAM-dependent methyltransferase [Deltaproteobacteria bacterium]|nr:class I SAM-dependent methyltransferase [Deltaproteobacteria bacterium]